MTLIPGPHHQYYKDVGGEEMKDDELPRGEIGSVMSTVHRPGGLLAGALF